MPQQNHNVITLAQLHRLGACWEQRKRFVKLFGKSVEVTVELAVKHAQDFIVSWLADTLLSEPARAEYERVTAPAGAEYDRVTAAAWAEYARAEAAASAEYARAEAAAWAEYARAEAAARVKYDRVRAAAWATAFLAQRGYAAPAIFQGLYDTDETIDED